MPIAALVAGLLVLAGIGLVVWYGVGRRIGTEPRCRRCRFDLTGITLTGDPLCPECGSSLAPAAAIRRGMVHRRPGLAAAGALLVFGGLAFGFTSLGGLSRIPAANKPTWLLMFEARSTPVGKADAAAAELWFRRTQGKLSDQQLDALIEPALRHQADPTYPWSSTMTWPPTPGPWAELLYAAVELEQLSPDQRTRYARHAVAAWTLEESVRGLEDGRPLVIPEPRPGPGGLRTHVAIALRAEALRMWVDGEPVEIPDRSFVMNGKRVWNGHVSASWVGGGSGSYSMLSPTPSGPVTLPLLPPGRHDVRVRWRLGITDLAQTTANDAGMLDPTTIPPPDVDFEQDQRITVTVVTSPSEVLQLVGASDGYAPPSIGPTTDPVTGLVRPWKARRGDGADETNFEISLIGASRPPSPGALSADVYGRVHVRLPDGTLTPLLDFASSTTPVAVRFPGEEGTHSYAMLPIARGIAPGTLNLTLVILPEPEQAVKDVDAKVVWNEPIIIENVPLDWSSP